MKKVLVLTGTPDSGCVKLVPKGTKLTMVFEGAEDFVAYIANSKEFEISKKILTAKGKQELPNPLSFDLIVNVICDPDSSSKALNKAVQVVEAGKGVPVINHPLKIFNTSRDKIYQLLKDVEGLIVPKVWKFSPKKLKDIYDFVKEKGIKFPFLFRPAGSHTGQGLVKIDTEEQISELERFAFDGSQYYIIEYHDFKSEDGLYRKYRVYFVDKTPYPRHLIISKNWNIHGQNIKELMHQEKYKNEEIQFFNSFNIEKYKPLKNILQKIDLEYFAVDFGIDKNGKIVIFEVNSCGKLIGSRKIKEHEPFVKKILSALENLFNKKVSEKKI